MLLDLSRFRTGSEHLERRFEPSAFPQENEDFRLAAPVDFSADVRKDSQKVRLVGRVKTTLELDCGRCLEPFTVPVDAAFDLLFLPASSNKGDEEREVDDDDLGVSFYKEDVIDLGEVMREQFYLALPMKPLCREDCQGLCVVCGINKNRATCSCQPQWVDPRLDALRKLRENS
jgi:DUF177 domain-containing protein